MRGRRGVRWWPQLAGAAAGLFAVGVLMPLLIESPAHPHLGIVSGSSTTSDSVARRPVLRANGEEDAATAPGQPSSSGTSSDSAEAASTATTSVGAPLKLGFLILDLGGVGSFGVPLEGLSTREQEQEVAAFTAALNADGGIAGHPVESYVRRYDTLERDSLRAACLHLVRDVGVFAVFGSGGYGDDSLCVTEEHGRPFFDVTNASEERLRRARGLNVTIRMRAERNVLAQVANFDDRGELRGHTIGIVSEESPGYAVPTDDVLMPELARRGRPVAHHVRLSSDPSTAASQMAIAIQQMRAKGVDRVLMVANTIYIAQFAQQGDAQGFRPRYLLNSLAGATTDFTGAQAPASWDAWGVSEVRLNDHHAGLPSQTYRERCLARWERFGGERRPDDLSNPRVARIADLCTMLDIFVAAAERAPQLTPAHLVASIQSLGTVDNATSNVSSLGPGKFDAPDEVRVYQWQRSSCECFMPISAWSFVG